MYLHVHEPHVDGAFGNEAKKRRAARGTVIISGNWRRIVVGVVVVVKMLRIKQE